MGREVKGLVRDLMLNIRLIQYSGFFFSHYHESSSGAMETVRGIYSWSTFTLMLFHSLLLTIFTIAMTYDTDDLSSSTVTCLFFAHSIVKFVYFSFRSKAVCRVLESWNQENSHPLFVESNARHKLQAFQRMRKLLMMVLAGSAFTFISWTVLTVLDDPYRKMPDPENMNGTVPVSVPKLPVQCWFPWDYTSGKGYYIAFVYQLYWIFFMLAHANLPDTLFCSTVIYACEQLKHLKEILKPLIEVSSSHEFGQSLKKEPFKVRSSGSDEPLIIDDKIDETFQPVYNLLPEFPTAYLRKSALQTDLNGLNTSQHDQYVASAIKYWVERHKHVVRFVSEIGSMYGIALLFHMLISTVSLTLLAYQATLITGLNLFGASVAGYLLYALAQLYIFCIYGNELIEQSSSVMEAAYDCRWYEGSEEAKTFVQIVCQQCQKSLTISGAKFFTVSLDLFASVLGAVLTYFMVLVQLK